MNASDTGSGAPCCESEWKAVPRVEQLWCRSQPVAAVHSPAQHQVCQGLASTPALTPDSPVLARAGTNGAQPKCAVAFLFTPFQPLP